jgi:hypothetical protein
VKFNQFGERVDGVSMWGHVRLEFYKGEELLDVSEGPNIVTDIGKNHMANLHGGLGGALPAATMAVGDGGAGVSPVPTVAQLYTPLPFVGVDLALRHPFGLSSPIEPGAVVDSVAHSITYTAFFNSANVPTGAYLSGIPNIVNEYALVSGNGVVIALTSRKPIPFDQASAIGVRAQWTIGWS